MVARARAKGLYDRLVTGELADFLAAEASAGARYDLVIAADVFVYISDIAPVVTAIARNLVSDGLLAFTVETHSGGGVKLLPTLRFAHGETYVRDVLEAAGLAVANLIAAPVRSERGVPLDSLVVVARPSTAPRRAASPVA